MKTHIPALAEVVDRLKSLSETEISSLSSKSGVSRSTLWKIRYGITQNPGVETFRKIVAHLPRRRPVKEAPASASNMTPRPTPEASGVGA